MKSAYGNYVPVLVDEACHISARMRPRGTIPWWLWDARSPCCHANMAEAGSVRMRFAMCLRCRTAIQDGLLDTIFNGIRP